MPTDRYTKIVLTIIAACLVALVCRDYAPPVQAQLGSRAMDVNIVGFNGLFPPVNYGPVPALPVRVVR